MKQIIQTGVIPVYPKPEDYKLGQETVLNNIENRTSDWSKYAPDTEKQYNLSFDTGACASFSLNNVIEFQLNYLLAENKMSEKAKNWLLSNGYIQDSGKVNLSDRYLAIVSNTTDKGNDTRSVAEAFRLKGAIPEKDLAFGGQTQKEYLSSEITSDMQNKAQEFLKYFKINWDWTFYDMATGFNESYQVEKTIQQAPIQIGIATPATHATTLYGYDKETKTFKVYDTYEPYFFDGIDSNYNPHFGMRAIIQEKVTKDITPVQKGYVFKMTLTRGVRGKEVEMLQLFLISQNMLKQGLATGFFGDITFTAVQNFQMKYGIATTGNVGQLTNAKINELNKQKKTLDSSIINEDLQISKAGVNLIKLFEGLGDGNKATSILEPYQDVTGYWTIGYGNRFIRGVEVNKNTTPITQQQANNLLEMSLINYELTVKKVIKIKLTQNQYDALVSFCFNLGSLKTLANKINSAIIKKEDFLMYVFAGRKKVQGLVNRRTQEANYYFK